MWLVFYANSLVIESSLHYGGRKPGSATIHMFHSSNGTHLQLERTSAWVIMLYDIKGVYKQSQTAQEETHKHLQLRIAIQSHKQWQPAKH